MSAFEQHIQSLKQQHASQISDMQTLLDKQSDHIKSLEAGSHSLQTGNAQAKRAVDSAKQQISILEKKLTVAKAEANTSSSECADLHAQLHMCESKLDAAAAAARHASDKEVNMKQQIAAMKQKLASSSSDQDILELQNQLEQADNQIAALQQQTRTGETRLAYILVACAGNIIASVH